MSTPATIKAALQAAITKANNTTGVEDTTVTGAVDSLIAGFGSGGKITTEVHEITFASDLGNGKNTSQTLLTNNAFIKKNISNDSMAVILVPVNQPKMNTGTIHFIYHGNRNIGASNSARTGVTYKGNNTSTLGYGVMTGRLDGENYNASFYADSTGILKLFVASALVVKAGTYVLTLLCGED